MFYLSYYRKRASNIGLLSPRDNLWSMGTENRLSPSLILWVRDKNNAVVEQNKVLIGGSSSPLSRKP